MKKKFAFILILSGVIVAIFCSPFSSYAFAAETDECTLSYFTDRGDITVSVITKGTVIENFVGYSALLNSGLYTQSDIIGKTLKYTVGETGEEISAPFTVNDDISVKISLEQSEETVTYTYAYGLNGKEEIEYKIGELAEIPTYVNGIKIKNGLLYSDETFTEYAEFKDYAEKDVTYYPLLSKTIIITFNGKSYSCSYGSDIKETLKTGTHAVKTLYTDEDKTVIYDRKALDNITLYGDYVRTHYSVTFVNGTTSHISYVPIENPVVTEEIFPKNMGTVEWRFDETQKLDFPITIDDDIVLYSSNGLNNPITKSDRIILYSLGSVLLLMIIWGTLYEYRKSKKKQKTEEQVMSSVGNTDKSIENIPSQNTSEIRGTENSSSGNTDSGITDNDSAAEPQSSENKDGK